VAKIIIHNQHKSVWKDQYADFESYPLFSTTFTVDKMWVKLSPGGKLLILLISKKHPSENTHSSTLKYAINKGYFEQSTVFHSCGKVKLFRRGQAVDNHGSMGEIKAVIRLNAVENRN